MARILLAEDDPAVREFVRRALAHSGHDVTAVDDGLGAIEMLGKESFDLVLKVSKDQPALPILMMTGYAAERQHAHNLEALIRKVIAKPFTLRDICAAVNETLAHHAAAAA